MNLRYRNYARASRNGAEANLFEWRVFVDEPSHVLDKIESVIYTLPPTFSFPSRTVTDADGGFALEGRSLNNFIILATVVYKDRLEETQQHQVDLSQPWPAEPVSA